MSNASPRRARRAPASLLDVEGTDVRRRPWGERRDRVAVGRLRSEPDARGDVRVEPSELVIQHLRVLGRRIDAEAERGRRLVGPRREVRRQPYSIAQSTRGGETWVSRAPLPHQHGRPRWIEVRAVVLHPAPPALSQGVVALIVLCALAHDGRKVLSEEVAGREAALRDHALGPFVALLLDDLLLQGEARR